MHNYKSFRRNLEMIFLGIFIATQNIYYPLNVQIYE